MSTPATSFYFSQMNALIISTGSIPIPGLSLTLRILEDINNFYAFQIRLKSI